ncbi:unnamed protein product, partial [Acanthoscelides obtectus]
KVKESKNDNIPPSILAPSLKTNLPDDNNNAQYADDSPISSPECYDSDKDPPFGICEARGCKAEVFSSCNVCSILLCWEHFMADADGCLRLGHGTKSDHVTAEESSRDQDNISLIKAACPEDFWVEGNEKENHERKAKKANKQKTQKS